MLGVQMLGSGRVAVREFPEPTQPNGEALIEIRASGICGSEMHGYRAAYEQTFNGGHEVSGIVVDAGVSRRLRVGDRVGVHAVWGCGACRWCDAGQYTYCDARTTCPGTHAERLAAPEHVCLRLPDDVSFDLGVLLTGDGIGVPYHVARRIGTRGGDIVCVFGAGPIGLGNILMQSFLGAEVIAVDVNDYRLELARQCGAAQTINPSSVDVVAAVTEMTRGELADKCIEAAARPDTLKMALRLVGKAGTVVAVGEQGDVPISPSGDLIRKDVTLMGSWFYHYAEYGDMLALYRRGLRVDKLITHRMPLLEADAAFALFAAGRAGKVILEPTSSQ